LRETQSMPVYQVVVLAIVQGITEFLPISSTAHLALAPWLLGWKDPGLSFDIALHIGTLAAVLLYFFRTWVQVVAEGFGIHYGTDPALRRNPRLLWYLVAGTIPVGVFGYLFSKQAETTWRSPFIIGIMLIAVGIVMGISDRVSRRLKDIGKLSLWDSIWIGLSQALAIVPGTSRSGITITAGLVRDLDRPAAAQFSFLLSTPAIAAAAAKSVWDLWKHEGGLTVEMRIPVLIGIVVSALVGWAVIAFFLKYLREHTLKFFVYYRIIFGIIVIALAIFFRHPAG
jgi:undecaprenyl-diphosphatase